MPKFPEDVGEACLPYDPADLGEAPLGHQGAPTRMQRTTAPLWPLLSSGAAAFFRAPGVGELRAVCGQSSAGALLGPWLTYCDLQRGQLLLSDRPFLGTSQPGFRSRLGGGLQRWGVMEGLYVQLCLGSGESYPRGQGAGPIAPTQPPPLSCAVSPNFHPITHCYNFNPRDALLPATPFLPFCGPEPAAQASRN